MISEDRYFVTNDTKLACSLRACSVGTFLEVDQDRSTAGQVYFVFSPKDLCAEFANKFYQGEVRVEPTLYEASKSYIHAAIRDFREELLQK